MALSNAQPKPSPRLLDKRKAQADVAKVDREQRAICKARSKGQCEVRVCYYANGLATKQTWRCPRRDMQNHHLISGIGRRNVGRSLLAIHRLQVCDTCHRGITGKILVPVDGTKKDDAAAVRYERIR